MKKPHYIVKWYQFDYKKEDNSDSPILEKHFKGNLEAARKFAQEKYNNESTAVHEESLEFVLDR